MIAALAALLLATSQAVPIAPVAATQPALEPGDSQSAPVAPPLLNITISPELGQRKVSYRDRVTTSLASYQSGGVGLLRISGELYPANGRGLPFVSDVGLYGSTSRSLRASAQTADGSDFNDLWHAWELGGRWRAIFGGEEWGALSFSYGSLSSNLSGGSLGGALLPTGTLQYWRPGLELRLPLGPFSIAVSGGYLDLVVQDAIGHAFPRAAHAGVDAQLKLALQLGAHFELHAAGKYTRFFYTLNPQPGDPFVAGGALDEYAIVELGFSFHA
jgi:hypothetical protein